MSLSRVAAKYKTTVYFYILLLGAGGIISYINLGQLEDPEFTVKTAMIVTAYPGADPKEVEMEVTDRIEKALQEMPELDTLYSVSKAGISSIKVEIKGEYWSDRLPQVWDKLRKKVGDITSSLPPGCGKPDIQDDFSAVYGFLMALTGDGYTDAELEYYADGLKRELSLVKGVARVELWGVQEKAIYLDVSEKQLALMGITLEDIANTLSSQNLVVYGGGIDLADERLRVAPTGELSSPEDIGNLLVRSAMGGNELIRIRDIGTVRRGYIEPYTTRMRFNGQPAIALAIANHADHNVVETGKAIDRRLAELLRELPAGVETHKISWQSDIVKNAVDGFLFNLVASVVIVLLVAAPPMGWRMGLIIGSDLLLTILGTFCVMLLFDIKLQSMSLGALIVALGMMVDNAIVVADGFVVRLKQGVERKKAALESAAQSALPLLGATVVAIFAFYPIFGAKSNAGEFCRTLFIVVATALFISWVLAIVFTPFQCMDFIPDPKSGSTEAKPFGGRFYNFYRRILAAAIRRRWLTIAGILVLLVMAFAGFSRVPTMFFSPAVRSQFMVDYWAPEGTRIQRVATDIRVVEDKLRNDPRVTDVSLFIGAGSPRFYLPLDPEGHNAAYAYLIVNTQTPDDVTPVIAELEPWMDANVPQALTRVRQYFAGPSDAWPFEARFIGSGNAELDDLRALGEKGMAILKQSPLSKEIRTDMRQRVKKVVPEYAQERARWSTVTREDIARATQRVQDGLKVGLYREADDLYPILLRSVDEERLRAAGSLASLQVQPANQQRTLPLSQVTRKIRVETEDPIIVRWNRRRAITVQAAPKGVTLPTLRNAVLNEFQQLEAQLPPGWELFWDGEWDSMTTGQKNLAPGIIPAAIIMLVVLMALFNAVRPTLVIIGTVPFVMIGIAIGLLSTGLTFGFMAILGALSLSGMMIKNAVVLIDQINLNRQEGMGLYPAVAEAAVSRLRPVLLASGTTILGVFPLVWDPLWQSMAVTIMAGLAFGTILTMVVLPVFYVTLHRIAAPEGKVPGMRLKPERIACNQVLRQKY